VPIRASITRWFQYLYFLRISLIAWLFLPVFCALDCARVTATLSRGILTLDSRWQVFYAAFFVVATNMAVLITVRNTVRNGESRFRSTPPPTLYRFLTDARPKAIWVCLLVAHIPTALAVAYLAGVGAYEGEKIHVLSLCAGLLAAIVFWYLVSLFYYWTYRPLVSSDEQESGEQVSDDTPAALIFPKYAWLFGDISDAVPPPRIVSGSDGLTKFFLRHISCSGYAATVSGPLWELHFLSALSLLGIFILYLFLYPLTGPVPRSSFAIYGQMAFCCLITISFLASIAGTSYRSARPNTACSWARPVKWTFILLALGLAVLFIVTLLFDHFTHSVRLAFAFPTLSSILVLAGFSLWLLSGVAFFLDRYRLPVLTAILALIFVPKLIDALVGRTFMKHNHPWLAQIFDSEHYYSVKPSKYPFPLDAIPTPARVMDLRAGDPSEPYIIVTASGGGIQAAEWTSQVLANLEKSFAEEDSLKAGPKPYSFHDHVVLASGVSGGSGGLMPFLLEYTAYDENKPDQPSPAFPSGQPDLFERITRPSGCSSLEAVGWGLSYHDFYRLITPFRIPSSLEDDTSPDRSWALASAFNRNLHDEHCNTNRSTEPGHERFASLPPIRDGEGLTLFESALRLAKGNIPAFAFNTTAAETGSRFLLSNYRVPAACGTDFTPAESFLQAYGADGHGCNGVSGKPLVYADLPLATAARLSATFPIVSSGTRIPTAYTPNAFHFLDGGYFDNDGTASVIEFLKSAMDEQNTTNKHHKFLLIEIRDDDGTNVNTDRDDLADQSGGAHSWTPLSQLTGIAEGLWNAGHVSISRRNRRELCILETAYHDRGLDIHHVVFTIPTGKDHLSPLSWNLTSNQLASIINRIRTKETTDAIRESIRWVTKARIPQSVPEDDVCRVWQEPPTSSPIETAHH
jgi:hypothetical protein